MKKISWLFLLAITTNAYALNYTIDNWRFSLDADGMVGFLEPKNDKAIFISNWDVKAQTIYRFNNTLRVGAVYSIDEDCVEDNDYVHDAFVLLEDRKIGRAEIGMTHSIARKMGLGLPDVGYLNLNARSILHDKLDLDRVLISDTTATTGHDSLRINLATVSTQYGQYGFSIAGLDDDYNYAIDFAVKLKQPNGKLKSAYSLALSYMDKPENFSENTYSPATTADWRAQVALGINLQYNSFIWGSSLRMIYDYNPTTKTADGLIAGTGISYDFLQSSVSLTYMFSDTNLWHHTNRDGVNLDSGDYVHTTVTSFRYKYSEGTSLFMSAGFASATPFFAVGLRSGF
jgi:hypothetical protein